MKDLFGIENPTKELSLSIYCDERMIDSLAHPNKENWIYIALLLVPDSKKPELLEAMNKHRQTANYNHEVKFRQLNQADKPSYGSSSTRLAKLWLQEVIYDANMRLYFKILGIKKDNLLFELFGSGDSEKGKYANIYNRFFRVAFLGALNSYFPAEEYGKITISGLFHHKQGHLEAHKFFPWHIVKKLSGSRINFSSEKICFIDSDHTKEPQFQDDSQFIQLIDVLVGSISHCLDLPTQSNEGHNEVAPIILPLIRDILGEVYSKSSRFDYFRKYDVSFYPSKKLTSGEFSKPADRAQSHFFRKRRILLEENLCGQQLPLL